MEDSELESQMLLLRPYMYRWAYSILRDKDDAEDAVQAGYLAAWQARATIRGESAVPWLCQVIKYKCLDKVKQYNTRAYSVGSLDALEALDKEEAIADLSPSPAELLEKKELVLALKKALKALPPHKRAVLELFYFGGLPQELVAKELSISVGTVKSRMYRAIRDLQRKLGGYSG